MKQRATALPNSPTFQQLWDALGSKLIEAAQGQLSSKQRVVSSNLARDATKVLFEALYQVLSAGHSCHSLQKIL